MCKSTNVACITYAALMIHIQMEDEIVPLWKEKFPIIVIFFQDIWNDMSVTMYTSVLCFGVSHLVLGKAIDVTWVHFR